MVLNIQNTNSFTVVTPTFILHNIADDLQVCRSFPAGIPAVSPVTTIRHVSSSCIHACATPGLSTGIIITCAAGVSCLLESEGELTQPPIICPAHDTRLVPYDPAYPGHVAQHVSVDPRPPVPQPTLSVAKTDHSKQDKVSIKSPEKKNCHN